MARQRSDREWSAKVTQTSDALDLEEDIFKSRRREAHRSLAEALR